MGMLGALSGIPSDRFWAALDELVATSRVVVDRPRGSRHPMFTAAIYPVDYGYLEGTTAADGAGIDIWLGSLRPPAVTAIACTVDANKRDAELKILLGCTGDEEEEIATFLNKGCMAAILVRR
jgi:inorganic pyrophosphatase